MTVDSSLLLKKVFSWSIIVYLIVWVTLFIFVEEVFGFGASLGLSLLWIFPFGIALRIHRRGRIVEKWELVFLAILIIVIAGGSGFVVLDWYSKGLHHWHSQDVEFAKFRNTFHQDPTFREVEIWSSPKCFGMHGKIATKTDLQRLEALAMQTSINWWIRVEVTECQEEVNEYVNDHKIKNSTISKIDSSR